MAEVTTSSGSEKNSIYERVFRYEFKDNPKFVDGWKKIVNIITESQMIDSFIKAQVFFFSREVEPVDLDGYKHWLFDNNKTVIAPDIGQISVDDKQENEARADSSETSNTQTVSSSEVNTAKHPKTFAELIAMIQSGLPLPDTDNLNIEPTNDAPSSPVMQRPKKPWEIHVEN